MIIHPPIWMAIYMLASQLYASRWMIIYQSIWMPTWHCQGYLYVALRIVFIWWLIGWIMKISCFFIENIWKDLWKPMIEENTENLNDINAVWVTSETVSNIGNLLEFSSSSRWPWRGHTRYQRGISLILPSVFPIDRYWLYFSSIDTDWPISGLTTHITEEDRR